jgi:hypothetical protein
MHFQSIIRSAVSVVAALSVLTGCQRIQEAMAKQQEEFLSRMTPIVGPLHSTSLPINTPSAECSKRR